MRSFEVIFGHFLVRSWRVSRRFLGSLRYSCWKHSGTSGHLDNGHSDFWSSGHLDFWPSFSMPKKCPNWDILDLPCCYTNLKFLTFSLESKTTNMLLPTFHAQFSRETTKPKTQPGRLAASWHIWYSFLSSRLQKDCFFFSFFYFFSIVF